MTNSFERGPEVVSRIYFMPDDLDSGGSKRANGGLPDPMIESVSKPFSEMPDGPEDGGSARDTQSPGHPFSDMPGH